MIGAEDGVSISVSWLEVVICLRRAADAIASRGLMGLLESDPLASADDDWRAVEVAFVFKVPPADEEGC